MRTRGAERADIMAKNQNQETPEQVTPEPEQVTPEQHSNRYGQLVNEDGSLILGDDGKPTYTEEAQATIRERWTWEERDIYNALGRAQVRADAVSFAGDETEVEKRLDALRSAWKAEYDQASQDVEAWRSNMQSAWNGDEMPFPTAPDTESKPRRGRPRKSDS